MERKKRWGGGASVFLYAVPSTIIRLACLLLNQTAWLVVVLWVLTHPLQLRKPCTLRVSCLSGWRPGHFTPRRHIGRDIGGGGVSKGEKHKREGQRGGWRAKAKGETLNTPELGLIYFINRDYKFNLQTRGQNFSLTRGPWRTSGLGDHSYYWLHISICLWCSMSAFLPPLSPSYFLAARLILIVAIEQSIVCL